MDTGCTRLMDVVHVSSTSVIGSVLIKYMLRSLVLYYLFRRLIHVATLDDPCVLLF
jgi:hypothetical protein